VVSEAKRLRALAEENRRLKKLLAEQMLDKAGLNLRARRASAPARGGVEDERPGRRDGSAGPNKRRVFVKSCG